ncbi:MAG: DJ-1/PfpI family protein [Actinomycetota bacterium]
MEVGIFVFEGADELDIVGPYRVFGAVGDVAPFVPAPTLTVRLVAEKHGPIRLAHGMSIDATESFESCPPLDVLFLPGGGSNSETAGRRIEQKKGSSIAFVRERAEQASIVASVCTGAFLLAEAGLLAGRRANTHWHSRAELGELMERRGEKFELVPQRVVWDGDLVSGGGVTSGIDIALEIVARLCGEPVRAAVEAVLELETPPA